MSDREKAQNIIDDLCWIVDRETYKHFLWEHDRLCKMNEVGREDGSDERRA
ncbi:MAG: hypothetical protein K0Q56_2002 [Sporolactobacillus laevolacticus]|jgi:hypothetical protein|nr:hypothetical protein [Sporolactobacillus laevolacticus]